MHFFLPGKGRWDGVFGWLHSAIQLYREDYSILALVFIIWKCFLKYCLTNIYFGILRMRYHSDK